MNDYYQLNELSATSELYQKYLQLENYEVAYEHSINIRLHPNEPEELIFKARSLYGMGKFPDAEDALLEAFKIANENEI